MNPETDPPEILDIACKYLTEPLPDEWTRAFTKDRLELLYVNLETNEILLETDLEVAARKEYEDYMELIKDQNEKANTKIAAVPRTKIAPIGSKQNQKSERESELNNKKKSKSNKNKHNPYEDEETKQVKSKYNKKNKPNNTKNIDNNTASYKHNPSYNNEIFQPENYEENNNELLLHHNKHSSDDYDDENIKIDNNFQSNNDTNEFSLSQKYARNDKRHKK